MGYVPRGVPRGKKELERFYEVIADRINSADGQDIILYGADGYNVKVRLGDDDGGEYFIIEEVDGDDLFKMDSAGLITLVNNANIDNSANAGVLNLSETLVKITGNAEVTGSSTLTGAVTATASVDTPKLNTADADTLKIGGEVSTRNAADNSMYVPVTDSASHERLWKIAASPAANGGGYFETVYINTKVAANMAGTIRASEHKVSVTGTAAQSGEVAAVLAKVNAADSATVASAIGVDVLLEEEGTAAIASGIGVRVQGGAGVIDYAIDASGLYRKAALKIPKATGAAITAATLNAAFGITEGDLAGDDAFVGLYADGGDSAIKAVFKYAGRYKYVTLTDPADS